jgi:hypothetical protein
LSFLRCFLLQQEFLQLESASTTSSSTADSSSNSITSTLAAAAKRCVYLVLLKLLALASALD